MMKKWIAILAFSVSAALSAAAVVPAESIEIIGTDESERATEAALQQITDGETGDTAAGAEGSAAAQTEAEGSETVSDAQPLHPEDEGITAEEAVSSARTLYSQMQHYADVNDNTSFAALFEPGADARTIQDQLQSIKSSLSEFENLEEHADLCFFDPTKDSTQSPYYFAVALCDYDVDLTGAVKWYSTLMKVAKYEDGWRVSISPAGDLLRKNYPDGFITADDAGYNTADLYPSLGMRFASGAVFNGALYALPNLLWQNEAGELLCAVWIANGTDSSKWCDTIDLIVTDKTAGDVTKVNVPVQTALEAGQSTMVTCTIPAEYVDSADKEWTEVSVSSNMKYQ